MDEDLKNLTKFPWASIPELAGFRGVNRTSVSRKAEEWKRDGLVAFRPGGRLVRPRARLLPTTGGLIQVFPQQHVHPGPDHDYHKHDPLHPELEDHEHPGFFNSYRGALDLWEKLDRIEMWYPAAPEVLRGEGAAWTHDGKARKILSWRWLRHTRFIEAVATYEDEYRLFFGHVGRSVTERMLESRWTSCFPDHDDPDDPRFHKLVMRSRGEREERLRNELIAPYPDLDNNPMPSAYVISTPDFRGLELARRVLPKDVGHLYLVGPPPSRRIYEGRAEPAPHDDVADAFEILNFGDRLPQDLCPAE